MIFLIACMVLSNVANAAKLCCATMETQHIEHSTDMPCHDMADSNGDTQATPQHDCECEGCAQFSVVEQDSDASLKASPSQITFNPDFVSVNPSSIYSPPRQTS